MSAFLESFHFLRPAALLLAVPVVLVWWLWRRRSDPLRGWRAQIEPELLSALSGGTSAGARWRIPVLLAWLLAVAALAGPSWKPEPSPFADDATPLVILLKADRTMDTPDPEPNRMERAHLKISDLAAARKGQPLGLIAYAGSAHLVLPPTRDTSVVAEMAAEISPAIMPTPGNRLDLAIASAAELTEGAASLLIVTDSAVDASPEITAAFRSAGRPFSQVLAITSSGAAGDGPEALSKSIDADLHFMTDDDSDVLTIVKKEARPPVARDADGSVRWQDGGYFLVPLIAVLSLLPFRREAKPDTMP